MSPAKAGRTSDLASSTAELYQAIGWRDYLYPQVEKTLFVFSAGQNGAWKENGDESKP